MSCKHLFKLGLCGVLCNNNVPALQSWSTKSHLNSRYSLKVALNCSKSVGHQPEKELHRGRSRGGVEGAHPPFQSLKLLSWSFLSLSTPPPILHPKICLY